MAINTAKVTVIDHSGKQFNARRSWVDKHAQRGNGVWRGGNLFQFFTEGQMAERRAIQSRPSHRARIPVSLRANDPTPEIGGAPWITYPFPDARARSGSLRERFPDLARAGAGMR